MLMATVGITAGASAIMAIDGPLARWHPPLLLGTTCIVLAFQGGLANGALASVFVLLEQRAQELAVAHETMRRLATFDDLTGLVNRRHMTLLLHHRAERHRHGGDAFSITLIDLDHFKQINDAWSHAVGDEVLKGFADVTRNVLHDSDIIARWGGEEFLILLPHTPRPHARSQPRPATPPTDRHPHRPRRAGLAPELLGRHQRPPQGRSHRADHRPGGPGAVPGEGGWAGADGAGVGWSHCATHDNLEACHVQRAPRSRLGLHRARSGRHRWHRPTAGQPTGARNPHVGGAAWAHRGWSNFDQDRSI
jgi:GGDEF domain-containing protein